MSAARDERSGRPAESPEARSQGERPPPAGDSPRLEAVVDGVGAIAGRLTRVWRALSFERRLAGFAAIGLFLTLFLPWYQETVIARGVTSLRSLSQSLTGWGAFSFVEAAVLLVAAGVLLLLFVRAEGEAFHVPGGDGTVITAAGAWACVLIIWRMFDKQGTTGHGLYSTSAGIEWGIFVALAVAGLLTYAGTRIRLAHDPEPPLPGERPRRESRRGSGGRSGSRGSRRTEGTSGRPSTATNPDWVAEDDIEETWLQLERDLPRRTAPPPTAPAPAPTAATPPPTAPTAATTPPPTPAEHLTAPLTTPGSTEDLTAPLTTPGSTEDATAPLSPPPAAPAPRRRRPRSIAEPAAPSGDDQSTVRVDRPS
jgi:hypothetical protein